MIDSLGDKLEALRSGKVAEGLRLDLRTDEWFRYKQGTFNIILGHSNIGKTHFSMFLFLTWTIKHNIKWCIWSSENKPQSLMRKVLEFATGQLLTDFSAEQLQRELMYWGQYFRFMNTEELETTESLLEKMQEEYDKDPFDAVFIDPYNSLAMNKDSASKVGGHEYHLESGTRIRNFTKQLGVSAFVAMHPNTESARRKHTSGEYNGLTQPPNEYDVSMGSIFVARADDFYVMHRYIHHPDEWMWTHLHVAKVKEMETGGRPTPHGDPLRFRSTINNLGFELDGSNIISNLQKKGTQSEIALSVEENNENLPF